MQPVKSSHWKCSVKRMLLKILQILPENTCVESFFDKVAGLQASKCIKKHLQQSCFPVRFVKFSRAPNLKNISKRLLLTIECLKKILCRRWNIAPLNEFYNERLEFSYCKNSCVTKWVFFLSNEYFLSSLIKFLSIKDRTQCPCMLFWNYNFSRLLF